ncbi:MAG: acetyl/propionyl/methylcrotonyl-CoA carboxylase subunit alpha [bacterium]
MIRKLLVANRGEIACRVIRSAKALGIDTVAVHSEADAGALHVALAGQSVAIGPAAATESYLLADRVLAAAVATGADAIHPGYGFLAENATFAAAVEAAGLTWVGPTPQSIDDMGDKERARAIARAAGVPVLPGSERFAPGDAPPDAAMLEAAAAAVGYPLLVKAAAGGGGIGMRRVDDASGVAAAVASTQALAARAFKDGSVYLERYVPRARHVEVQVFGFGDGRAVHLYERDCSTQRRFQKVIEESPAPGLSEATRLAMCEAATALACEQRYRGAGTVEVVGDADTGAFFFLEMNTRIQVEHPVTEMNTGTDLVAMQLLLAGGAALPVQEQAGIAANGHAIEVRLYAERPLKGFLPSTGTLATFEMPAAGDGLRVDAGVRAGDAISHWYDPMIAKVIAHGASRGEAIDRLLVALGEVRIEGVETNLLFLQRTLDHASFRAGEVFTGFIDAHKAVLLAK